MADAIFLDLPSPWDVIESVAKSLKPNANFCTFSPCIEQVQKSCEAMKKTKKFINIITKECLLREYDSKNFYVENVDINHIQYSTLFTTSQRKRKRSELDQNQDQNQNQNQNQNQDQNQDQHQPIQKQSTENENEENDNQDDNQNNDNNVKNPVWPLASLCEGEVVQTNFFSVETFHHNCFGRLLFLVVFLVRFLFLVVFLVRVLFRAPFPVLFLFRAPFPVLFLFPVRVLSPIAFPVQIPSQFPIVGFLDIDFARQKRFPNSKKNNKSNFFPKTYSSKQNSDTLCNGEMNPTSFEASGFPNCFKWTLQ